MSLEGDTADKMVKEGIEVTEAALRLAGLGAKNLAALLLALLRENEKLMGKTNMGRLLRADKPLATFAIKREDFAEFSRKAKSYGILFSCVQHVSGDKALCDVIAQSQDAGRINLIFEALGYREALKPAPLKEEPGEKNAQARALPGGKLSGHGHGLPPQEEMIEASPSLVRQKVERAKAQLAGEKAAGPALPGKEKAPKSKAPVR